MLGWIKNHALLLCLSTISALVAATSFMFVMWRGAEADAKEAEELARVQGEIILAQTRISENEQHVDRTTAGAVQRVMEAPNAEDLVPPDLADAWLDGIDSLRNGETPTDERHEDVSGLDGGHAVKREPKVRHAHSNVVVPRSGVSKM